MEQYLKSKEYKEIGINNYQLCVERCNLSKTLYYEFTQNSSMLKGKLQKWEAKLAMEMDYDIFLCCFKEIKKNN